MEMLAMPQQTLSLGERILLATRLAVEEHLRQSVIEELQGKQQNRIGGADSGAVMEDSLLLARGCALFGSAARLAEGEAA
jgi:hypothetical protein